MRGPGIPLRKGGEDVNTNDVPDDAAIDADLALDRFDPAERFPEYGHDALRVAYRAGFTAGVAAAPQTGFGRSGQAVAEYAAGYGNDPQIVRLTKLLPDVRLLGIAELLADSDFDSVGHLYNDDARALLAALLTARAELVDAEVGIEWWVRYRSGSAQAMSGEEDACEEVACTVGAALFTRTVRRSPLEPANTTSVPR